ncbi:MAG: DEAD/DEAH box helicase [Acidimicrobiales bacterium]
MDLAVADSGRAAATGAGAGAGAPGPTSDPAWGPDDPVAAIGQRGGVVHTGTIPGRPGVTSTLARPLPATIGHLVPPDGLWRHQVEAIDLIRAGRSVAIATGTASGKSRCYQIPIAEAVVSGLRAQTSMLIYPTKALAQDQLRSFGELAVPGLTAAAYDGDASPTQRSAARSRANVVLTNPEMLHYGILPHHGKWATFLKRLRYLVIDELHVLRGVFGTHVGHLLRRLRRVCLRYGGDPTFVFTSATIGEPARLAGELCGKEVTAVTGDASPCAERRLVVVQPATVDPERGGRRSATNETVQVVADLVRSGRRVICFCGSRAITERVALGVARVLPPGLADTVRPYRSGYLAAERREIEAELTGGRLRAVVTTSALELGIDISGLDATVLCGFPGTIASMWQQIGRSGRAGEASVSVLVAGEDQLDQWFVAHPDELFGRPPEPVVVNLANPEIAEAQLGCAAYESPLRPTDERWWPDLDERVRRLVVGDLLRVRSDRRGRPRAMWDGGGIPMRRIGLRSASIGEVRIQADGGELVGTVERQRASHLVHPGAVYLHRGQAWRVTALDLDAGTATVEPDDGSTWTQARSSVDVEILDIDETRTVGPAGVTLGWLKVTSTVTGYQVRRVRGAGRGHRRAEAHDLDLPPQELVTTGVWYQWDHDLIAQAGIRPHLLPGALHAAEHAAIGILPLFTICDRWDVGGVSIAAGLGDGRPAVVIYDGYPGGAGIAPLAYRAAERHLAATVEVIDRCPCTTGCPSCVQSPKCGNGNEPLDPAAAVALLRATLDDTAEPF